MLAKDYTHIYLDMDGTIADLYNVPGWLDKIHSEEKGLYLEAKPLITEEELLKQLPDPTHIWVVTMGPVVCSLDYKIKVFEEKEMWLKKYFPSLLYRVFLNNQDHKNIYSWLKHDPKDILLIDDNEDFRNNFDGDAIAPWWV